MVLNNNLIYDEGGMLSLESFVKNSSVVFDKNSGKYSVLIHTYPNTKNQNIASTAVVLNYWIDPMSDEEFDLKSDYFKKYCENFSNHPIYTLSLSNGEVIPCPTQIVQIVDLGSEKESDTVNVNDDNPKVKLSILFYLYIILIITYIVFLIAA
jgi:hypothetical protein